MAIFEFDGRAPEIGKNCYIAESAEIIGNVVHTKLNQLYAGQSKFVLIEVSVPRTERKQMEVAAVNIKYRDMQQNSMARSQSAVFGRFVKDAQIVARATNKPVMVAAVGLIANETNKRAIVLRDKGKVEEARRLLRGNFDYLNKNSMRYGSNRLQKQAVDNEQDAKSLTGKKWKARRKQMRKNQYNMEAQQMW